MSLTIAQPLLPTSFKSATAQSRREPYKWALSAIYAAGERALAALVQKRGVEEPYFTEESSEPEEEEASYVQIAFAEHALKRPLEAIKPGESADLSKIVPDAQLQHVVSRLLQCESFRNYWGQTLREGMFCIRFANRTEENHIMKFAAQTHSNRTILLRKNMKPEDLTKAILFELGNLKFAKNPMYLDYFPSADACARHIETQEYESWMNAHRLSASLLEEGLLSNQPWPNTTQEEYFALQEQTGHTDLYRARWYDACDPAAGRAWRAAKQKGQTV